MTRITLLDGHPDAQSLCAALAGSYARGAASGGHDVRRIAVRDLRFDPVLHGGYRVRQELEPDLRAAQATIEWCQHLVVVLPIWWGSMPALLKGFFDRAFLPGWAFRYRERGPYWDRLLAGRSARLIATSDAPALYNWVAYRNAPTAATRRTILRFCGFDPVRVTALGGIRQLGAARRGRLLTKVEALGRRAR